MNMDRGLIKSMIRFGGRQAINVAKLLLGRSVTCPAFGSVTLDEDDVELARSWLKNRNAWYRTKEIEQYHARFAEWNGSAHAFSFIGGRVALSSIVYALDLHANHEVVLPGYTCVVVPNAFHYSGVKTIFSDIELQTYGLDADVLESSIGPAVKAITLQHLYGLVSRDLEKIIEIARRHQLRVIEDCAHSAGAEFGGKKVGNFGDAGFFSSEQSKIFTTIQGGVAVTNDRKIAARINDFHEKAAYPDAAWIERQLYNVILNYNCYKHPQRWWRRDWYTWRLGNRKIISTSSLEMKGVRPPGYGCKMPAPIASLGLRQLDKIDRYNALRRKTAARWDLWCDQNGYRRPLVLKNSVPVYLRYPVLVEPEKKRSLSWSKKALGFTPGVWFVSNIHPTPHPVKGCPNADEAVMRCINFPTIIC